MSERSMATFIPLAILVLGALILSGCTGPPFERSAHIAIGMVEESAGDQYTFSAAELTTEWTFTREERFVLSFDGGSVSYRDESLEPACYSGVSTVGAVLSFDGADEVHFAAPAEDASCRALPG